MIEITIYCIHIYIYTIRIVICIDVSRYCSFIYVTCVAEVYYAIYIGIQYEHFIYVRPSGLGEVGNREMGFFCLIMLVACCPYVHARHPLLYVMHRRVGKGIYAPQLPIITNAGVMV